MALEFTSLPLASVAGVLSILSPCVWPLIPMVMASSANASRWGLVFLALGLSLAFALAGGVLTFVLLNLGLPPDALRWVGTALLILVGLVLLIKPLGEWANTRLSMLSSRFNIHQPQTASTLGQLAVGFMLGLVWLPCVGPTLGAAIALASVGQSLAMASAILFCYGLGCALALIVAAVLSQKVVRAVSPGLLSRALQAKQMLGGIMVLLGLMIFTGLDKQLETLAIQYLPDWSYSL
ncbi:cytochrome c biogenesis CcdA family protein [Halioxenophilus aromaticivorans]|uniref:Cytochrome c biogenesis protein CcdA n=1 Tax=Halioxenophilus aromaticivorans TaxID=1306992 RepID=A0AAV3U4I5_9ALTE